MGYPIRVRFDAIREVAFGSIGAVYTAVGSALTLPARIVRFTNTTDVDVYLSIDGVTNHIRLVTGSFLLLDLTANKVRDDGFFFQEGTVFYVKRAAGAPASGLVAIEVIRGG